MTSYGLRLDAAERSLGEPLSSLSILHVLAPSTVGGAESVVHALAVGQGKRGHVVRVAAVVSDGGREHPFVLALREEGVDTVALEIGDRAYLRERSIIADLCRRWRPTVVHTHGFRPDVMDAPVARRLGVPTITTVHGFTGGEWRLRLYERVQRLAFRSFDAVAAVSRALAESLAASGVRRERIHVVPNALARTTRTLDRAAARRGLAMPDDQFVVGWVGRLSREKGPDVLLEAVARLGSVPVRVAMFGEGPEREALSERACALGIGERIAWHGVVPNASTFYRAFDVLVLSSRAEGCPIVLLEAMAAGVPIVATRVGGVPEMVSAAQASLVPAEDPAALAGAVLDVYRDRASAASRAGAAHARLMAEFHPEAWVARYDSLYRGIQGRPAERR